MATPRPSRAVEQAIFLTTDAWHALFVPAYPEGRGGLERELVRMVTQIDEAEAKIRQLMEEEKKEFTGETLAAMLKVQNEQLAAFAAERQKVIVTRRRVREEEITPIERYLATTPEAVLRQPAIPKSTFSFRGFMPKAEDNYHEIAVLDETYLDKSLPPEAAQVIVASWSLHGPEYPGARLFTERWKQGFPFEKLRAMVDR